MKHPRIMVCSSPIGKPIISSCQLMEESILSLTSRPSIARAPPPAASFAVMHSGQNINLHRERAIFTTTRSKSHNEPKNEITFRRR
ncbi:hypothetical protein JCGZ_18092 [Jatropha curcas]|uniref:Uncharacterized protein n=1 Tax=Jatropha curcas TaxID=180498 RepID=A0A067KEX8_JATCU|nr:hypothetical protein JCGZ_18092 [Jatropha curcas]